MNNLYSPEYSTSLAIVGMAGRFPGASTLEGFWQNIANRVSSIQQYSDEELLAAGVKPEDLYQPNYVKAGTVLENIENFDTSFFGFSQRDAEILDPQFRIFLECVWEALEVAGYDLATYKGLIGVFAGAGYKNYLMHHIQKTPSLEKTVGEFQIGLAEEADVLATMISYKLNLKGPSVSVQSYCSTSLVATHLACQSLLNYECDIAVAGGVALNTLQKKGYFFEEGRIVSADGTCRPFDADAHGSVLGNGSAVVALKRLKDALDDGDQIYSIVRGSAMNNDGNQRVSYTAPGLDGQATVIASAMSYAGIKPETVSYIEANGTGTRLGDAIELAALNKAFAKTHKEQFCAIGALKPNIGHLDRASGVAGLIRTTLAMNHRQLPPSLHYEHPNPEVDLTHSPFYINTKLIPWSEQRTPRRAGINSFGLGGTNVHLVLEEAPEREPGSPSRTWQILPVSAKSEWSLRTASANLAAHLKEHPEQDIADVAYTLQVGRSAFSYRQFVIARTTDEAQVSLEQQQTSMIHQEHRDRRVAFLFPDGDPQFIRLAGKLCAQEPEFGKLVARCCEFLCTNLNLDLQELFASDVDEVDIAVCLKQREIARPAMFIVAYALAQVLIACNIRPQAMLGYGVGEYVAACVAGALSLEDALTIVTRQANPEAEKASARPRSIKLQAPGIPLIASATGTWTTREQIADTAAWLRQAGQTASLENSLTTLLQDAELVLLEIGTEQTLGSAIRQNPACTAERQMQLLSFSPRYTDQAALLWVLGSLWQAGVTIDWPQLSSSERRLRVELPTYPFERHLCWIDDPSNRVAMQRHVATTQKEADIANWFYLPYWEPILPPMVLPQAQQPSTQRPYLIFADAAGMGTRIAQRLEDAGRSVVLIEPGNTFARQDAKHYTLRPDMSEDYLTLFQELNDVPETILHCWNLTPDGADEHSEVDLETGFTSLLSLARAIGSSIYDADTRLIILSNHVQTVTGQELPWPAKAPVLAACKVIAQEYPSIACQSIDLSNLATTSRASALLVEDLTAECLMDSAERVVAYRGNTRWGQRHLPAPLTQPEKAASPLRHRGVYLLIGGLTEMGLMLAEHMVTEQQARVVLIDEAAFPATSRWSEWLENHPSDDLVSQAIQRLQALEARKSQIQIMQAELTDAGQLKQIIEQVSEQHGAVHGVLYLVNGADFQTIQDIDLTDYTRRVRTKMQGLKALAQALQDVPLDFCLLFSSLTGVLGGLGCTTDAALSTLTDAFAYRQNQSSATPWLSVDWDPWYTQENEQQFRGTTLARHMILPEEGMDALSRVLLASRWPNIVASTGNLHERMRQWITPSSTQNEAASQNSARREVSTEYVAPTNPTEQKIVEIWQLLLGLEQIGIHDNFFELHGHSLLGMQLISRLRQVFQVNIPLTRLFEGPTVAELAAVVEALIIAEIEQLDEEEAQLLV